MWAPVTHCIGICRHNLQQETNGIAADITSQLKSLYDMCGQGDRVCTSNDVSMIISTTDNLCYDLTAILSILMHGGVARGVLHFIFTCRYSEIVLSNNVIALTCVMLPVRSIATQFTILMLATCMKYYNLYLILCINIYSHEKVNL